MLENNYWIVSIIASPLQTYGESLLLICQKYTSTSHIKIADSTAATIF